MLGVYRIPTEPTGDELKRELGLLELVLLSVGGMVGAAIFVFPGATGQIAGPASILAWLTAGLLMALLALCYTELALAFPKAGGPAVFPYETLGPNRPVRVFASYLEGICYSIGWAFGITVSALAIADYMAIAIPAASGHTIAVALAAIGLGLLVNLVGVSITSRANLLLSAVLLTVLINVEYGGFGPMKLENEWRIAEYDPPRRQMHVGEYGLLESELTITVDPEESGTRWTQTADFETLRKFVR